MRSLTTGLRGTGVSFDDDELSKLVSDLTTEGLVQSRNQSKNSSFNRNVVDDQRLYLLCVLIFLPLCETVLVILSPEEIVASVSRQILGLALLGFLPGYAITNIIFPAREISVLERVLLSVFLSVTISITAGVALGTLLLFRPIYNVAALAVITVVSAFIAGYRYFANGADAEGLLNLARGA